MMPRKRDKDSSIGPVVRNVRVGNTIESILMSDRFGNPLERGMRKGLNKVKPNRKDMQRSSSFQKGGMIPPEKKGFNMLSEEVQQEISPKLADEFMHGGEVEAPSQNVSRGTRAAIKGTKFSGVY
tara:strand:+ start:182 stop:556 length:375 start_codon:yes stop_codon:yes gene_type:complete